MGHSDKSEVALDTVHHAERFVTRASTGTIGNGTEVWISLRKSWEHSVVEAFFAFSGLGREKLH
jgi:hypothetical protein